MKRRSNYHHQSSSNKDRSHICLPSLYNAKMKTCLLIIGIFVVEFTNGNSLGAYRKRFNGNPQPDMESPNDQFGTGLADQARFSTSDEPAPSCCKTIYRTLDPRTYPEPAPVSKPSPSGNTPQLPAPVRPTLYYQAEGYRVMDRFRNRELALFDPEAWVRSHPGVPFPSELDIPQRWFVYNAVTVQAPKPYVNEQALRERSYTGYYYACPERVSPYRFSWFMRNDPINPCKWIFYQTARDAGGYGTKPGQY